ncbi:hypothetical protein BKA80DRAFT_333144 [Phyllosticta citrichinensis]
MRPGNASAEQFVDPAVTLSTAPTVTPWDTSEAVVSLRGAGQVGSVNQELPAGLNAPWLPPCRSIWPLLHLFPTSLHLFISPSPPPLSPNYVFPFTHPLREEAYFNMVDSGRRPSARDQNIGYRLGIAANPSFMALEALRKQVDANHKEVMAAIAPLGGSARSAGLAATARASRLVP